MGLRFESPKILNLFSPLKFKPLPVLSTAWSVLFAGFVTELSRRPMVSSSSDVRRGNDINRCHSASVPKRSVVHGTTTLRTLTALCRIWKMYLLVSCW